MLRWPPPWQNGQRQTTGAHTPRFWSMLDVNFSISVVAGILLLGKLEKQSSKQCLAGETGAKA